MKNNQDNMQKCEFLLKLSDNIVCQRYFTVRKFNDYATNSMDLHELVTYIADDIESDLKRKTLLLLDSRYYDRDIAELNLFENEEYFTITIKRGTKEVYQRAILAHIYPPKVRFTVDIRPKLNKILRDLTDVLSQDEVVCNYQDYELNN
jgi:hypothetical protein